MFNWKFKKTNEKRLKKIEEKILDLEKDLYRYSSDHATIIFLLTSIPEGFSTDDYVIINKEKHFQSYGYVSILQKISYENMNANTMLSKGFVIFKEHRGFRLYLRKEKLDLLKIEEIK